MRDRCGHQHVRVDDHEKWLVSGPGGHRSAVGAGCFTNGVKLFVRYALGFVVGERRRAGSVEATELAEEAVQVSPPGEAAHRLVHDLGHRDTSPRGLFAGRGERLTGNLDRRHGNKATGVVVGRDDTLFGNDRA